MIFFCIYKMYLISAEKYTDAGVHFLKIRKTDEIWASMKDVESGMGMKNISGSLKRNIWYLWEKNLTKAEIKNYKMTEREIYEKFDNLSEDELNTKSNRNIYVKNDIMTTIIKRVEAKKEV